MKYRHLIILLLFYNCSIGQSLDLQTIQTFFASDSISLKAKCADRNFILTKIEKDDFQIILDFQKKDNAKISMSMTYATKGNPNSNKFQYLFQDKTEYQNFIYQMKESGFTTTKPVKQKRPDGEFVQSLYQKDSFIISLGTFKQKGQFSTYILTSFLERNK